MATVTQTQVRCAGCNRRLADVVNEVEAGQVLVEWKCPRCGQPHLEVIRRCGLKHERPGGSRSRCTRLSGRRVHSTRLRNSWGKKEVRRAVIRVTTSPAEGIPELPESRPEAPRGPTPSASERRSGVRVERR